LRSHNERPDFLTSVLKPIAAADLIASYKNDVPNFAPGTSFKYCNAGYFLLGEIVGKVSGQPLEDYYRKTFFEPLGMSDSGFYSNANPPPGAALGYAVRNGAATRAPVWDTSWSRGAGAIYSTVGDLFRWTEALHGGRVVNADSLRAMTTPNPLPPGVKGLNYGFGLNISQVGEVPAILHTGSVPGWSSRLTWLPELHVTLVALANAQPADPDLAPAAITRELTAHFFAGEAAKLPAP
jgi:CubicO group peptidase (beta-lactamase class C family)